MVRGQKATDLLGKLGGTTLFVAAMLTDPTHEEMVKALSSHFGPWHLESSTAQLSTRSQKRMESLTEFGRNVRDLAK